MWVTTPWSTTPSVPFPRSPTPQMTTHDQVRSTSRSAGGGSVDPGSVVPSLVRPGSAHQIGSVQRLPRPTERFTLRPTSLPTSLLGRERGLDRQRLTGGGTTRSGRRVLHHLVDAVDGTLVLARLIARARAATKPRRSDDQGECRSAGCLGCHCDGAGEGGLGDWDRSGRPAIAAADCEANQ